MLSASMLHTVLGQHTAQCLYQFIRSSLSSLESASLCVIFISLSQIPPSRVVDLSVLNNLNLYSL